VLLQKYKMNCPAPMARAQFLEYNSVSVCVVYYSGYTAAAAAAAAAKLCRVCCSAGLRWGAKWGKQGWAVNSLKKLSKYCLISSE